MRKNKLIAFAFVLMLFSISGRSGKAQSCAPYLGEIPPDSVPVRFGNGTYMADSTWWWHGSPVFSPDGAEMYFTKYFRIGGTEIWYVKCNDNQWTEPQKAAFSDRIYVDNNPRFCGNDTLFFTSQRSIYGFLFRMTRSNGGEWSQPIMINVNIPSGYGVGGQFSITKNRNIYGELEILGSNNVDLYIWRKLAGNQYDVPHKITEICSPELDFCPEVDPDEKYLIFSSGRTGSYSYYDLYISYKNEDNTWSVPLNMGYEINSDFAFQPKISPDGTYLFFNSLKPEDAAYNAYWVKAEKYINVVGIEETNKKPISGIVQIQNHPNPCNLETTLVFELIHSTKISVEICNITGNKVVDVIQNKFYSKGRHEIHTDVSQLPSGTYFYSLMAENGEKTTRKMIIIK